MAKLFISYASTHRTRVIELASDLTSLGHEGWFDRELTGGQSWWDHILERIRECDAVVLVLTSEALDSEACRRELSYALALGRTVLPVRIDQPIDLDHVPPEVTRRQIVEYGSGEKSGVLELNRALQTLARPGPLPDPLPVPPAVPISYVAEIIDEIRRKDELTYDEQVAIVFRLRDHLSTSRDVAGVSKAFQALLDRRELYAKVRDEIQQTLARAGAPSSWRTPARSPASVPRAAAATQLMRGTPPPKDPSGLGCGLGLVSFLLPLVGFIFFVAYLQTRPRAAGQAMAYAVAGMIFGCFCGAFVPAFVEAFVTEFDQSYQPYPQGF